MIGKAIEMARLYVGVGPVELSRRTQIGRTTLWRYEAGQRDPQVGDVERIGQALGIPGWKILRVASKLHHKCNTGL